MSKEKGRKEKRCSRRNLRGNGSLPRRDIIGRIMLKRRGLY